VIALMNVRGTWMRQQQEKYITERLEKKYLQSQDLISDQNLWFVAVLPQCSLQQGMCGLSLRRHHLFVSQQILILCLYLQNKTENLN